MHATVIARDFHAALKNVSRAIPKEPNIKILGNVHMSAVDGAVTLSGTNLELALRTRISSDTALGGAWTVPAHTLLDWLSVYPDDATVAIHRAIAEIPEIEPLAEPTEDMDVYARRAARESHTARVQARERTIERNGRAVQFVHNTVCADGSAVRSRMTLGGIDAEDYPVLPNNDGAAFLGSVSARDMIALIKDTAPFAATDKNNRAALFGIHLTPYGYDGARSSLLYGYATDGYRASYAAIDCTDGTAEPITVAARAMKQAMPLLGELDGSAIVQLYVTDGKYPKLLIVAEGTEIGIAAIECRYPVESLRSEFASTYSVSVDVKRLELDKLLKRSLATESAEGTNKKAATIKFGSSVDTLSAESNGASDTIDATLHGSAVPAHSYFAKQVSDTARSFSDKTITLSFCDGMMRLDSATSHGARLIMRVMTATERKRREYRTIGAHSTWTAHKDGAATRIDYHYSAEMYARSIGYKRDSYAERQAELDAVLSDMWEGYTEPSLWNNEPSADEIAVLTVAREYHRMVDVRGNVYPRYADHWTASGNLDVNGYHNAIAAYVARENELAAMLYEPATARGAVCRALMIVPEPRVAEPIAATAPLMIAARSAVRKDILPPGLPIAEECDSAIARRIWREYQDIVNTATRVYERGNSRRYHYGSGIVILHELPFVWADGGLAEEIICVTTHYTQSDRVLRGMQTTYYDTIGSAYRAMMATVPERGAVPPGRLITAEEPIDAVGSIVAPNSPIVDAIAEPIIAEYREPTRKPRKRRTVKRSATVQVDAITEPATEPRNRVCADDAAMFDTSGLPSMAAPHVDITLPATAFTVPDRAAWRHIAEDIATIARVAEPATEEPIPERATRKRSIAIVRSVDGSYTVA